MADTTLTAAVGAFAVTGHSAHAAYGLTAGTGQIVLNPPRSLAGIALPPAIGTKLFWRKADGTYRVVIP